MMEVEAKARIISPEKFRIRAQKIGRYKGKERKIDDYYTLESGKDYPKKSLRIRRRAGFYEINFKQRISYAKGVYAKNETEFKINEINDFLKLLNEFGFRKWLTKEKYTEIYEIKKNFHIELNHLTRLGWFVEVEYLCNKSKISEAREEVLHVLNELGVSKKEFVKEGYTKLLWNKK